VSGRGAGTAWNRDGRGNYWSGYRGFDFDGDGVGEAPHPLVTPYAAIEGANPIARLFLGTPAAAGLDLAARVGLTPGTGERDLHPIVGAPAGHRQAEHQGATGAGMLAMLIVAMAGLAREGSSW
jgi:nitrous oxidase accessory protein NosD